METSKPTEKEKREAKEFLQTMGKLAVVIVIIEWIKDKWKISHLSTKFLLKFIGVCIILFGFLSLYQSIFAGLILIGGLGYYGYIRHFGEKRKNLQHYRTDLHRFNNLSNEQIRKIEIIYLSAILVFLVYSIFTGMENMW
tara:strand:- start:438 stop:857 length:420 start_codon:yes stop_codon:yes gene_type:complete